MTLFYFFYNKILTSPYFYDYILSSNSLVKSVSFYFIGFTKKSTTFTKIKSLCRALPLNIVPLNNDFVEKSHDYIEANIKDFVMLDILDNFLGITSNKSLELLFTLGPLTILFFFVMYFFLKFTFLEKNLIFSLNSLVIKINLVKEEKEQSRQHFLYRLFVFQQFVVYAFKKLKIIFFFFTFFMFCFYTFLVYCPLGFTADIFVNFFSASYGFFISFNKLFFLFLLVGFLMFIFFYLGQFHSLSTLSLNFEIPFLFAFSIIIFLLSLQVQHFLLLFLCFEIFSYTLYILVSLKKRVIGDEIVNDTLGVEAGLKYFIMGSLSSFILMFGFCLFLMTGNSLTYSSMSFFLNDKQPFFYELGDYSLLEHYLILGFFCVIMYFFFKLSLFPFHWWVPEVFNGASWLTIFFISVPVKLISVFLLLQLFTFSFSSYFFLFKFIVLIFSPFSLIIGTLGMFYTTKLKPFIAFSTVYNMAYILLLLSLSKSITGLFSLYVYLFGYLGTMLFFFSLVIGLMHFFKKEILFLNEFSLVKYFSLILNFFFIFLFFSMLGLPPFAGFWGKYYTLFSLIQDCMLLTAVVFKLEPFNAGNLYLQIISTVPLEFQSYYVFLTYLAIILILLTSIYCCYIYLRIIVTLKFTTVPFARLIILLKTSLLQLQHYTITIKYRFYYYVYLHLNFFYLFFFVFFFALFANFDYFDFIYDFVNLEKDSERLLYPNIFTIMKNPNVNDMGLWWDRDYAEGKPIDQCIIDHARIVKPGIQIVNVFDTLPKDPNNISVTVYKLIPHPISETYSNVLRMNALRPHFKDHALFMTDQLSKKQAIQVFGEYGAMCYETVTKYAQDLDNDKFRPFKELRIVINILNENVMTTSGKIVPANHYNDYYTASRHFWMHNKGLAWYTNPVDDSYSAHEVSSIAGSPYSYIQEGVTPEEFRRITMLVKEIIERAPELFGMSTKQLWVLDDNGKLVPLAIFEFDKQTFAIDEMGTRIIRFKNESK